MLCVVCAASTHGLCVVYSADVSIVFECGTYGISVSVCGMSVVAHVSVGHACACGCAYGYVWSTHGCVCMSVVCLWTNVVCIVRTW